MSNRIKIIGIGIAACSMTLYFSLRAYSSHIVVFCDVGQGAATFLQMGSYQALIDTGPDQRVLSCMGNHMPFFDHTIEAVIISHNQKDHVGGLIYIMKKYKVLRIYGHTDETQDIILHFPSLSITAAKASQSSSDLNESAYVATVQSPNHTIFLPSDINGLQLKRLIPPHTTILEVPHHGSKYGLYPDSLNLAHPTLAVISVGKKNTYGHPSKEALDILKAKNIKVWQTDLQGELVIDL